MPTRLRIDFVSDVSCPWCAVGLKSLQQAIAHLAGEVEVDLHFQPFELNPQMPPAGEDTDAHLARKFGASNAQLEANREVLRERGAEVGFAFNHRSRIYNTFDAHRLLHWADAEGPDAALALKLGLLEACFRDDRDVSSHEVLVALAGEAGLEPARAARVLASDEFAPEVRAREQLYQSRGIQSVPSVIVQDRHLIQGGQPAPVFEQALRQIAADAAAAAG